MIPHGRPAHTRIIRNARTVRPGTFHGSGMRRYDRRVPDPSVSPAPTFDLQLTWRGTVGRIRVYDELVRAETSFERDALTQVPMDEVRGWRIEPCDFDAVCVEFVTASDTYRVLLDTSDERIAALVLGRALGDPLPSES